MGALTLDRYGNLVVGTLAIQRTASEVCSGGFDALVDRWMDGKCISHGQFPPLIRSSPGSHCPPEWPFRYGPPHDVSVRPLHHCAIRTSQHDLQSSFIDITTITRI